MAKSSSKKKREKSAARPAVAGASVPTRSGGHWALETSWSLCLAALILAPVLTANLSWLPGDSATSWLKSGSFSLKAWVMQALAFAALALFGYAYATGQAALRWHWAMWPVFGFLGWSGIATLTSTSWRTSLIGFDGRAEGLLALAVYTVAAFLVLQLADTPVRIRQLLRAVGLTAAVVALYGVVQHLGFDPLTWGQTPWGGNRSFSTIGNPDMFGAFMVLNLFVVVGLFLSEDDVRWRRVFAATTFVVGLASFTSLTRAAWAGAVVGAIIFTVLAYRSRPRIGRLEVAVAVALVVAIAAMAAGTLVSSDPDENVAARAASTFDAGHRNTSGRLETWRIGLAAVAKRPILGWGPDTFPLAFEANKTEAFARLTDPRITQPSAHSSAVQTAAETGVPGVAIWIGMLAAIAAVTFRWLFGKTEDARSRPTRLLLAGVWASCAGYVAASLLTPSSPPSSLLLWTLFGLLLCPLARPVESGWRWRQVAGFAVAGVAVLLAVAGLDFVYADTQAAVAINTAVDSASRVFAAESAHRLNPLSAEYASVAARAYGDRLLAEPRPTDAQAKSDFDRALTLQRRSVDMERQNPVRRDMLVSLLLVGGERVDDRHVAQAVKEAAGAREIAPLDLETSYWYARALVASGDEDRAIESLRAALEIQPGYGDAAILLSDLYTANGDKESARRVLEEALARTDDPNVRTWLERLGSGTR